MTGIIRLVQFFWNLLYYHYLGQETAVFWTTERNGGIWSSESRGIPGSRGIEEEKKSGKQLLLNNLKQPSHTQDLLAIY